MVATDKFMRSAKFGWKLNRQEKGALLKQNQNDLNGTHSISRQMHRRKNAIIIGLSMFLGCILFGIFIQLNSIKKRSNSFDLFQTTFEWDKTCLKVVSRASLKSTSHHPDEMLDWE